MARGRKSDIQRSSALNSPSPYLEQAPPVSPSVQNDNENSLILDPIQPTARTTRSIFKGVVIPQMDPSPSAAFKRPCSKRISNSSISDAASPASYEDSSEYDTAATSTSVTPAASVAASSSRTLAVSSRKLGNTLKSKTNTTHRVVDSPMVDTSADARLAQMLQQEEYAAEADEDLPMSRSKGKKRLIIADSDNEESVLSDISVSSDDVPLAKRRRTVSVKKDLRKQVKTARKPAISASRLPKRQARTKAQNLISKTGPFIDDSDDSPLSDFISGDEEEFEAPSDLDHFDGVSLDESDEDDESSMAGPSNSAGPVPWTRTDLRDWRAQHEERKRLNRAARERKKLETAHPEIKTMWRTLQAIPQIATKQAPQPESITRTLKSFQLEGLNWMIEQEKTQWKGGLLGDEMGMGKTIQAVSLIMSDYPAKEPTLVIVPPVALMQWTNEIKDYTNGKLKVLIYHGSNTKAKALSVKELKAYNVIMISYAGLESIYRKETKGWTRGDKIVKEDSAIHAIKFHRLILDEAHSIKSRTAGVAKACFALNGRYKWCLSGTPVQNRIGEFFSLLRFLNVQPFANYFCKSCPCSTLHWSVTADYRCTHCNHRALDHVSVFNQEILNPLTTNDSAEVRKDALRKLRLLTDRIMLRRVKRDHTSSMELPPKEVIIHNEFFGEIERDFSSSIMSNTTRQFDTYVSRGVMLNNYANIFGLIMQMRQVSDHPDLLLRKHAEGGQNVLVCNVCDEPAEEAVRSKCKHEFCRSCVKEYVRSVEAAGGIPDCPRCHIALAIDFDQPDIEQDEEAVKKSSIINRIKMENWTSSTKIEMLVYDLYKLRSKKQTLKSIVFSQFTSMLQLIEWRLRRAGFNTVMLDGTMTPAQRQKSIEHFMNNTDVEVFLVSLKAGGVALNLTEASRVFIVDPWWNPAAEWQSADRCHRIGQRRPCVITRLCIEDSVESRIVMLQEKKANMISGTIGGDDVAMEKLTPEDMQFLFRGS